GITTNTFEVTDSDGNVSSCSFDVTVNDTEAPVVDCQDLTIELDSNGQATITSDQLVMNSQSYIYALDPFSSTNNIARYNYDVSNGNLTVDNTYSGNTALEKGVALDYDQASGNYYVLNRVATLSQLYSFDIDTN